MPRRFRQDSNRFAYVLGFVGCVLFPAFVTAIAPVSVTHFERQGQEIVARAKVNLLFVIPYHRVWIDGVTAVDDRFHEGELSLDRFAGESTTHQVRSEDEAFLVIHGRNGQAEVSVSPANIRSVLEKARTFLATPTERELRLVTVANWKFGVLAGGLLSLLTVLYLIGVLISLWRVITGYKKPDAPPHKWKPQ